MNDVADFRKRVPAVDDCWQVQLFGKTEKLAEDPFLGLRRGKVSEEIQANFPHSNHPGMLRQTPKRLLRVGILTPRMVWVDSHRRVKRRVSFRQFDHLATRFEIASRVDEAHHIRLTRPGHNRISVVIKRRKVEMYVAVYKPYAQYASPGACVMITCCRNFTAFWSPSIGLIRLSSCSMLSVPSNPAMRSVLTKSFQKSAPCP